MVARTSRCSYYQFVVLRLARKVLDIGLADAIRRRRNQHSRINIYMLFTIAFYYRFFFLIHFGERNFCAFDVIWCAIAIKKTHSYVWPVYI